MQLEKGEIEDEDAERSAGEPGQENAREDAEREVVANAVMPGPIGLLAGEDAEAVEIGHCGGDHREQALPGCERWEQVGDAPAGHDVRGDLHRGLPENSARAFLADCEIQNNHGWRGWHGLIRMQINLPSETGWAEREFKNQIQTLPLLEHP